MPEWKRRYDALCRELQSFGSLAVAFSGGVDSTLLLRAAFDALGPARVLALTVRTACIPAREDEAAARFCAGLGVRQEGIDFPVLEVPGFRDNPLDRCYLCKKAMFSRILKTAGERGFPILAEGSNMDDGQDYRPGMAAIAELGVYSPLRDACLTKDMIRQIAKHLGLREWDKPAMACLATRIAYGQTITPELLSMVDRAEQYLMDRGFRQVRVRVHGGLARIEVAPAELDRLLDGQTRAEVSDFCLGLGFGHVCVDLAGYHTGSMNKLLPPRD